MLDDVDGHGEDDGGVVLGGDGGEGLQVPGVALVNILLMVVFLREAVIYVLAEFVR